MSSIALHALTCLINLILTENLRSQNGYYSLLTDEDIETRNIGALLKVTELISDGDGIFPRQPGWEPECCKNFWNFSSRLTLTCVQFVLWVRCNPLLWPLFKRMRPKCHLSWLTSVCPGAAFVLCLSVLHCPFFVWEWDLLFACALYGDSVMEDFASLS